MSTTYMEVETSEAFVTDDVPETIPAQQILQGHDEIVWAMEVSGRHLFSASADKTIRVWDTMALRCVTVRARDVDRTASHSDHPLVFCVFCGGSEGNVCVVLQVLEDHTRPVLSLAVTDTHLYSGSYDCTIRVWELETLTRVAVLEGHTDAVRALVVAGGKLFSGSYDNTVRVWDLASLEVRPPRAVQWVHSFQSSDGTPLACLYARVVYVEVLRTCEVWWRAEAGGWAGAEHGESMRAGGAYGASAHARGHMRASVQRLI
jgi:F-box/WD-40 domain protein 7